MTRARRERLILDNMPLVRRIARQCARQFSPRLDIQDFMQDGYVGLCDAARRCSRVSSFPQFAYFRIRGAMVDSHRRKAYREELNISLDRQPGVAAWVERPDMRPDTRALPDELAIGAELGSFAQAAIAELPEDERFVIRESIHGLSLLAIAAECDRSETWARGKLTAALSKVASAVVERAG